MLKALLSLSALTLSSFVMAAGPVPQTVKQIDLDQFAGRWYEVASSRPAAQRDCACTTVDYSLLAPNEVKIVKSCRRGGVDGPLLFTESLATVGSSPAKFKVSFSDYQGADKGAFASSWVVDLADDYRYVVLSNSLRNPIFVLSRSPELAADDLTAIRSHLQKDGFNLLQVKATDHASCTYTE